VVQTSQVSQNLSIPYEVKFVNTSSVDIILNTVLPTGICRSMSRVLHLLAPCQFCSSVILLLLYQNTSSSKLDNHGMTVVSNAVMYAVTYGNKHTVVAARCNTAIAHFMSLFNGSDYSDAIDVSDGVMALLLWKSFTNTTTMINEHETTVFHRQQYIYLRG